MRALIMANIVRKLILPAALGAALSLMLVAVQTSAAAADSCTECSPSPRPRRLFAPHLAPQRPRLRHRRAHRRRPRANAVPNTNADTTPTDGGTSGNSINGLAGQRFNQMITNQVLGSVLLGVNEQVNCNNCVSAFGSVGSFTAGVHGRKEITNNLSLLAGLAYTQYSENGYHVTSAPIGAFALRYDFSTGDHRGRSSTSAPFSRHSRRCVTAAAI